VTEIIITPDMTMEEVMQAAPAAQRALFQRYHVGGCSACGFEPHDTLGKVAKDHNVLDVKEMIETIKRAQDLDTNMRVAPTDVKAWLDAGEEFSFIDCRTPQEWELANLPAAERLDYDAPDKYMSLPKDRRIVFTCHTGDRSLDVASYFVGHGFTAVYSMRGGLDAWSQEVDSALPRYEAPAPA
jgi:rhodanese-related sulfurtransferase